jgi:hypothetical protein
MSFRRPVETHYKLLDIYILPSIYIYIYVCVCVCVCIHSHIRATSGALGIRVLSNLIQVRGWDVRLKYAAALRRYKSWVYNFKFAGGE